MLSKFLVSPATPLHDPVEGLEIRPIAADLERIGQFQAPRSSRQQLWQRTG
jgi:hypothetical protein